MDFVAVFLELGSVFFFLGTTCVVWIDCDWGRYNFI